MDCIICGEHIKGHHECSAKAERAYNARLARMERRLDNDALHDRYGEGASVGERLEFAAELRNMD